MTTPKPTPREALSHLCWALTHGENADEDVRVLSAALEQLSGNPGELDALRAEVAALTKKLADALTPEKNEEWQILARDHAALTKKLEEAEKSLSHVDEILTKFGGINRLEALCAMRDKASRATELAARVEALETGLNALLDQIDRGTFVDQHGHDARMLKPVHDGMKLMTSTPAADLAGGKDEHC